MLRAFSPSFPLFPLLFAVFVLGMVRVHFLCSFP